MPVSALRVKLGVEVAFLERKLSDQLFFISCFFGHTMWNARRAAKRNLIVKGDVSIGSMFLDQFNVKIYSSIKL